MDRETNPHFQLACYNWLVDNKSQFPNSTFVILLFVVRQTIGFQKDIDFIRYSQIIKKTGLAKGTISTSINWLLKREKIFRYDCSFECLPQITRGFRGEIYYRISEELYQEMYQYYVKTWTSTISKNDTYKEKYIQTESNTKNNYDDFIKR